MLLTLWFATALAASVDSPPSGRDIIRSMHDRYADKWYHTLSFVQQNTATRPAGGKEHSVWREYLALPGRLRIEFEPTDSGNGLLFVGDSQFVFRGDTLATASPYVHPLMVLGFDVYFDPIERTVARLSQLGFDLALVHEEVWQQRPVWVVGAPAGDQRSRQFWVDKERLVFVRLLERDQRDTTRISEVRFDDYRRVGAAWLSAEVAVLTDGKERWLEQYTEIRTDPPLPEALFDPRQWSTAAATPRAAVETTMTVQGFVQEEDGAGSIVVPSGLEARGYHTFVLVMEGDGERWSPFVGRYVEAKGRVALSPDVGGPRRLGIEVDRIREVEPPGTGRRTVDRGLALHAEITLAVIPNRFAWYDKNAQPTGVNPVLLYRVTNQLPGPIRFVLPTNDLLCVSVTTAEGIRTWEYATQAPQPSARRIFVQRGGTYRETVQLPVEAARKPGRYRARAGLCAVSDYEATTEFEVR